LNYNDFNFIVNSIMRNENLYFIALIPKRTLREKITAFKQDFAKRFNSSRALKVYSHITLKAPFKQPPGIHSKLLDWFDGLHINQKSFSIQLKDFGAFANRKSPVVYVNPVACNGLFQLQEEIIGNFLTSISNEVDRSDIEYNPHMTIAYRDLTPEMFAKAWQEYKNKKFDALFEVDAFYLLQHDSKKWNIIATCHL
jgi:2'-5' RNA ligase